MFRWPALLVLLSGFALLGACDPAAELSPGMWETDWRKTDSHDRTFYQNVPTCCPGTGSGP